MQLTVSQKITLRKITKSCHPLPIFTLKLTILPNVTKQHWVIQRFSTQDKTCQSYLPGKEDLSFLILDKLKWDIGTSYSERLELGKTVRNLTWPQSWLSFEQACWCPLAVPSYLKYSLLTWFLIILLFPQFVIHISWDTMSTTNKFTYG